MTRAETLPPTIGEDNAANDEHQRDAGTPNLREAVTASVRHHLVDVGGQLAV